MRENEGIKGRLRPLHQPVPFSHCASSHGKIEVCMCACVCVSLAWPCMCAYDACMFYVFKCGNFVRKLRL